MNLDTMVNGLNELSVDELRVLIEKATEVKKAKAAMQKETEKEKAEERAALSPADYKVGEKVMCKYYSDWYAGTVVKVNQKSVKVVYNRRDRKTGTIQKDVEVLMTTDKLQKVEEAVWDATNARTLGVAVAA